MWSKPGLEGSIDFQNEKEARSHLRHKGQSDLKTKIRHRIWAETGVATLKVWAIQWGHIKKKRLKQVWGRLEKKKDEWLTHGRGHTAI